MNPVSLSATSITWTTLPALVISITLVIVLHGALNYLERRYFPVDGDV